MEEMKIQFDIAPSNEEALFNEEAYFAKIDRSIAQIDSGKTKRLSKENQWASLVDSEWWKIQQFRLGVAAIIDSWEYSWIWRRVG